MQEKIPFRLIKQCYKTLLSVYDASLGSFDNHRNIVAACDAVTIAYISLNGGLNSANKLINKNDAQPFFRAAKELIKLLIPFSNYDKVNQFRLDLGALAQAIFPDRTKEISSAMEPNFKAPELQGSIYPADEAEHLATLKLLEKIEEIDPEPPETPQTQGSSSSSFVKFCQKNPNLTSILPHAFWPIPASIGLTYLSSLAYDASLSKTSIDSVNEFFSSKLRDASSLAEGLKTPGAIYGLATLLAVSVSIGIYWYGRKKQQEPQQPYAIVPQENKDNFNNN